MDRLIIVFATCLACLGLLACQSATAQPVIRIGTGGIAGSYYPVGQAIAGLINQASANCPGSDPCPGPGVIALPQLSSGTVANLDDLDHGRVELALVQADQVPDQSDLSYSLLSALYGEAVHIVVAADSAIADPGDLAGLTVSIDEEGSGTRANALSVLHAHGIAESGIRAARYKPEFAAEALREGRLDAFFIVAGTPTPSVSALAASFAVRLLPVVGHQARTIVERHRHLSGVTIPHGTYRGVPSVETVGVEAYLVARNDLDAQLVEVIMHLIWSSRGREALARAHRATADRVLATAIRGKALPVHPGARAYAEKRGVNVD